MISPIKVAVSHLNVPYGDVLTENDLKMALCSGTLKNLKEEAQALIFQIFNECSPTLILKCAQEAGSTPEKVQALYLDTLNHDGFISPQWVKHIQQILI